MRRRRRSQHEVWEARWEERRLLNLVRAGVVERPRVRRPRASQGLSKELILKWIVVDETCGCWLWQRSLTRNGYGQLRAGGKNLSAHRCCWLLFRGAIAPGFSVLHKCDVRACCNPDHLYLGTQRENMRDRRARRKVY